MTAAAAGIAFRAATTCAGAAVSAVSGRVTDRRSGAGNRCRKLRWRNLSRCSVLQLLLMIVDAASSTAIAASALLLLLRVLEVVRRMAAAAIVWLIG